MTKSSKKVFAYKQQIFVNKTEIDTLMQNVGSVTCLNNLNWIRHEISYSEPTTLFYLPKTSQRNVLDFTCTKNLGDTYDYIVNNPKDIIDSYSICKIHSMLCNGTHLSYVGGHYRNSSKVVEITVNGEYYHAPEAYEIPSRMNKIIFDLYNSTKTPLNKAFDIHYELIALQPFEDFNKRTARLIMNWVLIQNGFRPIIFNDALDKKNYKAAIAACMNGNRKAYHEYMTSCMVRTQRKIINLLKKSKMM